MYCETNGQFIICDIQTNQKHITLATIYAPNDDDAAFFEGFFRHLSHFQCEEVVIGGHFNLVHNLGKYKKGGVARTHNNSVTVFREFMENLDLIDFFFVICLFFQHTHVTVTITYNTLLTVYSLQYNIHLNKCTFFLKL